MIVDDDDDDSVNDNNLDSDKRDEAATKMNLNCFRYIWIETFNFW